MKLLNQSIKHISFSILIIIGIWGVAFFFNMVDEIKNNVDEGLENYKRQIVFKAHQDTTLLTKVSFDEAFYAIRKIDAKTALSFSDQYLDTLIYIRDADDPMPRLDPVRMLITTFQDDGQYYKLKIINPMVEKDQLIRRLMMNMIILYVILIITIILVNNIVLKSLWKPFYKLLDKMQSYRLGKEKTIPKIDTETKEFIDLQEAIHTLLNQNIAVYEQQNQFIGNASHELQTPIAIAINKLELLLEEEKLNEEQAQNITEVLDVLERLKNLNRSLLLLTKIENKQFANPQTISITQIIKKELADLEDYISFKNIKVYLEEADKIEVEMDPVLAEILISNLIKNAIFHNYENGEINIITNNNKFIISNTGPGSELNSEKLFKRFFKSQNKKRSTGLGLSIVKAIADIYSIKINYSFKEKKHFFEVEFLIPKSFQIPAII